MSCPWCRHTFICFCVAHNKKQCIEIEDLSTFHWIGTFSIYVCWLLTVCCLRALQNKPDSFEVFQIIFVRVREKEIIKSFLISYWLILLWRIIAFLPEPSTVGGETGGEVRPVGGNASVVHSVSSPGGTGPETMRERPVEFWRQKVRECTTDALPSTGRTSPPTSPPTVDGAGRKAMIRRSSITQ